MTNGDETMGGGDANWWPEGDFVFNQTADLVVNKGSGQYINPDSCRME